MLSTSAQNFFKASPLRHGVPLDISFDSDQLGKLRRLHEAYWSGVRYNRDGSFHGGDEGDNAHDGDEDGGGGIPEALSRVSIHAQAISTPQPLVNPIDPLTGIDPQSRL